MIPYINTNLSEEDVDFLGYCEIHSRTPRALFSIHHVDKLCKLIRQEPYDSSSGPRPGFVSIHEEQMRKLLELIVSQHTRES